MCGGWERPNRDGEAGIEKKECLRWARKGKKEKKRKVALERLLVDGMDGGSGCPQLVHESGCVLGGCEWSVCQSSRQAGKQASNRDDEEWVGGWVDACRQVVVVVGTRDLVLSGRWGLGPDQVLACLCW